MASAKEINPRRLFLVSVPRTASNLLVKILDIHHQPSVFTNEKAGYFFFEVYMTAVGKGYFNKSIDQWTDAEKTEIRDLYQQCLDRLETASAQAQRDNKIMFTKEHAFWFVNPATMLDATDGHDSRVHQDDFRLTLPDFYGPQQTFSRNNKTMFPDEYLRTWQFAFLIRHPALAWPSLCRAMQKMTKLGLLDEDSVHGALVTNMTWRWTRDLYDWCAEQSEGSSAPLILDAYDVIHNQDVVLRFCEKTGLDRDAVQFEWDNDKKPGLASQSSQNGFSGPEMKAAELMTLTLRESKGVIKDKTPATVDIDAEVEKWKDEFGLETAAVLEKTVRATMPDYEYLRERCLKA